MFQKHALCGAALLAGSGFVAGCGSGIARSAVPPTGQGDIQSTVNFGDSITCGVGASSAADGYASLLDAAIGAPAINLCRSGDQAADMTRLWVLPNAVPAMGLHQVYTVLIGTNDAHACGTPPGCLQNWHDALETSLVWLALPASDKIAAQSRTFGSGEWKDDLATGLVSSQTGASLTYAVKQTIAGRTLYVAYRVSDGWAANPGVAKVELDGVPIATLSAAVQSGQPIQTQNGTTDTVFVAELPLGTAGPHTVQVTVTSTGGGEFSLQWLGVSSGSYAGDLAAPRVTIGSITPTESGALNEIVDLYNVELASLVASLQAQGMQIVPAPTNAALDPATDMADLLHPNDAGHAKLAQAFEGELY